MYFSLNDCQFKTSRLSSRDYQFKINMGFPGGSGVRESAYPKKNLCANAGDMGSIPGPRRSPGEGNNLFQYSCPEDPMNRGAWQGTVRGVTKSQT